MKPGKLIFITLIVALAMWFLLKGNSENSKRRAWNTPETAATESDEDESVPDSTPIAGPTSPPLMTPTPQPPRPEQKTALRPLSEKEVTERRSAIKSTLFGVYTAEAAYFAEYNRYSSDLGHIGYLPNEGTMKARFGFLAPHIPVGGVQPNEEPDRSTSDTFTSLRDESGDAIYNYDEYSQGASLGKYEQYCQSRCSVQEDTFEMISAVNLDNDETLDVWIIDHNKNLRHVVDDLTQ